MTSSDKDNPYDKPPRLLARLIGGTRYVMILAVSGV